MKRFAKKAFTLVELLVVIAIIAILAVAGVVGYMAFTKKAEVNNDTSLVAELNNYVAAASATDKINTPTDIRNILVDDGIDLATLKLSAAKQGYIPGFDIVAKKFVLIKDNALADGYTAAKNSDVFAFAKTEAEANALKTAGFSLYLQSGYDKATIAIEGLGLDVGENTGITTINYTGASSANEVVIRTNSYSTNLVVNTKGSVQHYGQVGKIDVKEVALNSFHEFGKARAVIIKKGNFVVEAKGSVTLVSVAATEAGNVKLEIKTQGELEVVAGDATKYEAVAPLPATTEVISAPIPVSEEGELEAQAIVDGVVKETLAASDFASANKVILLADFTDDGVVLSHDIEIIGNMTKLNAEITGNATIELKNIHTTNLHGAAVSGQNYKYNGISFNGSLTLDGGYLGYDGTATSNGESAAFYANAGYGTYVFKNMTIATNTLKGIKISKAKSVTISNCDFNAVNLKDDGSIDNHVRSLSAIDIQEQNAAGSFGQMTVTIKDCSFKDVPQGTTEGGVADSDTAGAIKIKTEKAARSAGFAKVTITGNKFVNCYRDVVVGCCVYSVTTNTKEQADMDAPGNVIQAPTWEIANNTTTLTADVVANRATLTYSNRADKTQSIAEKVGRLEGGCGVWETARSARSWVA